MCTEYTAYKCCSIFCHNKRQLISRPMWCQAELFCFRYTSDLLSFPLSALFCFQSKRFSLCTGFNPLLVSLRRHLSSHDDDGANSFWRKWLAQRNFLAQHGSQLGHTWSASISRSVAYHAYACQGDVTWSC